MQLSRWAMIPILLVASCQDGKGMDGMSSEMGADASVQTVADAGVDAGIDPSLDAAMTPPADAGADGGVCGGMTVYPLKSGIYNTLAVPALSESCGLGVTAANLMVQRELQNDGAGTIVIYAIGAAPKLILGAGMVRCNRGTLTGANTLVQNGCVFTAITSIDLTVTGANQFTMVVTQTRSGYTQDPAPGAPTCRPPSGGSCSVNYTSQLAL